MTPIGFQNSYSFAGVIGLSETAKESRSRCWICAIRSQETSGPIGS